MWARIIEMMLGCWLAVSQFVFRYPKNWTLLRINDLLCAAMIVAFALASYPRRWRHVHLLSLGVALWLLGLGVFGSTSNPPEPAYQNYTTFAVLLGMIAIVPSWSSEPPTAWEEYYREPRVTGGEE